MSANDDWARVKSLIALEGVAALAARLTNMGMSHDVAWGYAREAEPRFVVASQGLRAQKRFGHGDGLEAAQGQDLIDSMAKDIYHGAPASERIAAPRLPKEEYEAMKEERRKSGDYAI